MMLCLLSNELARCVTEISFRSAGKATQPALGAFHSNLVCGCAKCLSIKSKFSSAISVALRLNIDECSITNEASQSSIELLQTDNDCL